jgi:hypothetical protein
MSEQIFSKIIVGKYSPENKCFAEDGAILTIIPKKITKAKDSISHYFVDSLDKKIKARYGWVKTTAPFKLTDFVNKYGGGSIDSEDTNHVVKMLESISKLDDDTPVAATYFEREKKALELKVHKVFFR